MFKSRPLPLRSILLLLMATAMACGEDADPIVVNTVSLPPRASAGPIATMTSAEAGAPLPLTIDLGGLVLDTDDAPIVGRTVVVVDHRGKRRDILTDEEGGFHIANVLPPYDLLLQAAPSGAVMRPVAYLGLSRPDPRIAVFESEGPITIPQRQPMRVGVKLPPCPAVQGACWVTVVSRSPSGAGGTAISYTEGLNSTVVDFEHSWQQAELEADERVDVHVLVGDAQYTRYSYTQITGVPAHPGELADLGMTMPLPVASSELVSTSVHPLGPIEAWQFTQQAALVLPDGSTMGLRYSFDATTALTLPLLPGAAWRLASWAVAPEPEDDKVSHRSMQGWSGTLPLAGGNVAFDLHPPPTPIAPVRHGTFSRRGVGFVWDGAVPGLTELTVEDDTHGGQVLHAFTSEASVPLKRLEALGAPLLRQGQCVLDLLTSPGSNVDLFTEPDAQKRRERWDLEHPGMTTHQRLQFTVTP